MFAAIATVKGDEGRGNQGGSGRVDHLSGRDAPGGITDTEIVSASLDGEEVSEAYLDALGLTDAIADAIDQLRRYANQRGGLVAEGSEQLFWTNQFTVATTGERAEAGTFSAEAEHYLAWKDPYPTPQFGLAPVGG